MGLIYQKFVFRRKLRKLRRLVESTGDAEFIERMCVIECAYCKKNPSVFADISEQARSFIGLARSFRVLIPCMWKAAMIWNDCSYGFLAERYPLEWKKAVALCPELEEIRESEK